jgi:hypothetical protein
MFRLVILSERPKSIIDLSKGRIGYLLDFPGFSDIILGDCPPASTRTATILVHLFAMRAFQKHVWLAIKALQTLADPVAGISMFHQRTRRKAGSRALALAAPVRTFGAPGTHRGGAEFVGHSPGPVAISNRSASSARSSIHSGCAGRSHQAER